LPSVLGDSGYPNDSALLLLPLSSTRGVACNDQQSDLLHQWDSFCNLSTMIAEIEINRMSVQERLQAIQQLWESNPSADSVVESPAWHEKVLDSRKQKVVFGKAEFLSLEALRQRLLSE
jgi:hypothetical protein